MPRSTIGRSVPFALFVMVVCGVCSIAQQPASDERLLPAYGLTKLRVGPGDWPQFGGTSLRNNAPRASSIPDEWVVAVPEGGIAAKNIKWSAELGWITYGAPVVANGKVFIGSERSSKIALGRLLCFDEQSGRFLWQHVSEELARGPAHPLWRQGVLSTPLVDGDRLWYVSNRSEIVCLDTEGFADDENDGPVRDEPTVADNDADVVWRFDLRAKLGSVPHQRSTCSVTCAGDALLVVASNGVADDHIRIPAPHAAAFLAIDRRTAEVLWTDNSPGDRILHGQWSSPAFAVLGGRPQALFGGGDGWLYSCDPRGDGTGRSKLLWKFDCNSKDARLALDGRGTANELISPPVIYDQKVYIAMGQDYEHGEGQAHLWCIDPTKGFDGGDVSAQLVVDAEGNPLPPRRGPIDPQAGDRIVPNPDSAVVWCYDEFDLDGNGRIEWEEQMHRSCSCPAIADGLLVIADLSGMVHCLDARTGKPHWTHDLFAGVPGWSMSPLIADGKAYVADEEGKISIFRLSTRKELLGTMPMHDSIYAAPIVANNVLYVATWKTLYAIAPDERSASGTAK